MPPERTARPLWRRLLPDPFILALLGTVALASLLPATGRALDTVGAVSTAAIVLLFFFHGARLPRDAVVQGMLRWRLHLAILGVSYAAFPLLGIALSHIAEPLIARPLWLGVFFLCALPTTVQSSIAYTSIAQGNVAAAVVASAMSNILGVVLAPLLFTAMAHVQGGGVDLRQIWKIMAMLLLPFALGQIARPWLAAWVERHRAIVGRMDRLTIVLAVYVAFSGAVTAGLWNTLSAADLALLLAIVLAMLAIAFSGAWWLGALLGLDRADRATLLFAGGHKSLATGAPMARILFPGAEAGALLLPLMLYHQAQLMVSAVIAKRIGHA